MASRLRQAVLAVADIPMLQRTVERHGQRFVGRFVAGESVADGLQVARQLGAEGLGTILDLLGEGTVSDHVADAALRQLQEIVTALAAEPSTGATPVELAVKLSHLGAERDPAGAQRRLARLLDHACGRVFLWIDMEGSNLTEATVSAFEALRPDHPDLGLVLQAYLRRSPADLRRVAPLDPLVRIVKGAYLEPAAIAYTGKAEVDRQFALLVESCFDQGTRVAVATHDRQLVDQLLAAARARSLGPDRLEFQTLYGVDADLPRELVGQGYRAKVYVPFGSAWYRYFSRRLAERPANLWFLARNLRNGQQAPAPRRPVQPDPRRSPTP